MDILGGIWELIVNFIIISPLYFCASLGLYKLSIKCNIKHPKLSWIPVVSLYNLFQIAGKLKESLIVGFVGVLIGSSYMLTLKNSPIDLGLFKLLLLILIFVVVPVILIYITRINIKGILDKTGYNNPIWWILLIILFPFTILFLGYKYNPSLTPEVVLAPEVSLTGFFGRLAGVSALITLIFLILLGIGITILGLCVVGGPVLCPISGFWH